MNSSISALAKTNPLNLDTLNAARRITPAQIGRALVCRWDLIGIVSLLISSGAYSIYAVMPAV